VTGWCLLDSDEVAPLLAPSKQLATRAAAGSSGGSRDSGHCKALEVYAKPTQLAKVCHIALPETLVQQRQCVAC